MKEIIGKDVTFYINSVLKGSEKETISQNSKV